MDEEVALMETREKRRHAAYLKSDRWKKSQRDIKKKFAQK
jgi:hypothetical protein